jgi:hypothetical protein
MIPMMALLRVERATGRRLSLWLPLFLFWLLALPFVLVALPIVVIVLAVMGRNPFAILWAWWRLFAAMPGTRIEVSGRRNSLFLMQVY